MPGVMIACDYENGLVLVARKLNSPGFDNRSKPVVYLFRVALNLLLAGTHYKLITS